MPKIVKSGSAATPVAKTSAAKPAPTKVLPRRGITGPLIIKKPDGREFIPQPGTTAQWYDHETDIYADVFVHKVQKEKALAVVSFAGNNMHDKPNKGRFIVKAHDLDVPMNPNINQRFEYFEKITRLALHQKIRSTLVMGEGGLGKTYTIEKIAREEGIDLEATPTLKGNATAKGLFEFLKENSDQLIFLDDCDSVFTDRVSANLLKAALDSRNSRKISWQTNKGTDRIVFTGSIIFISNLPKASFESATLSRATVIDLFMTPEEKIDRFRAISPFVDIDSGNTLELDVRTEIIDFMDKYKRSIQNLNARSLVKAFNIMAKTGDMKLVEYQILNS